MEVLQILYCDFSVIGREYLKEMIFIIEYLTEFPKEILIAFFKHKAIIIT